MCLSVLLIVLVVASKDSRADKNVLWSSKNESIAKACDISWEDMLGFTCECNELAEVSCKFSNITDVVDLDIPDVTTRLDLSHNLLTNLEDDFLVFPYPIQELFLSHNLLVAVSSFTFSSLHILEYLDLSHNQLKSIDSGTFSNLSRLLTLDISHNQITTLDYYLFPTTNRIQRLDLSYNSLKGVDGKEPSPLARLVRLMYLDMSNCSLDRLHVDFLHNNSQITELRLSKNNIDYIPTTALYDTRESLELLDITENPIVNVTSHAFHGLYGLKTLVMNSMPALVSIDALGFHDLHSLQILDCRMNPNLKHIHPLAFRDNQYQENLAELKYLYLSGNELTSISQDLIKWESLIELHLEGNPWLCDCELSWLPKLAKLESSWVYDLRCSGPENLAGILLLEAASEMDCEITLGMGTIALLVIIVLSVTLFLILCYMAAFKEWPHCIPRLDIFGDLGSRETPYFNLNQISVISSENGDE